jgi:hypothetical protein
MEKWSKKHDRCISCSTSEWKHQAKGYCYKCYPLIKRKELINQWNSKDKLTLKPFGPFNEEAIDYLVTSNMLDKAKTNINK